jgi:hypothetical protein
MNGLLIAPVATAASISRRREMYAGGVLMRARRVLQIEMLVVIDPAMLQKISVIESGGV